MMTKRGSLFLFRLFGVSVYVNWTWLIGAAVVIYLIQSQGELASGHPATLGYCIAQYLALFGIVLIHEFGHALACKSVGGRADLIVLMPLGGVAYVQPPQRPGPFLWAIAAGPLVNVVLLPVTIVPAVFLWRVMPHALVTSFLTDVAVTNVGLLIFNMLPFYPLDGGQILRSLIWFVAGRGLSLVIATIVGLIGAFLLGMLAIWDGGIWLGIMVFFMATRSLASLRAAGMIYRMEKAARREELQCPACREHPPIGAVWRCSCGMMFDTFETGAVCPHCRNQFSTTMCPFCQESQPMGRWYATGGFPVAPAPELVPAPPVEGIPPAA